MTEEDKNYIKAYKELVKHNIEFIKGKIITEKSNYEIIDSIEEVLEIISDNNSAQLHTLWKIHLFLCDKMKNYVEAALALNKAKKMLFVNMTEDDIYDEKQLMRKAENLGLVLNWITDLYSQLKEKEDSSKPDSLNYPKRILEEIATIKDDTKEIKNSIEVNSENLQHEFGSLISIIKGLNAGQIIAIERIVQQLNEIEIEQLEKDWETELFRDKINTFISKLEEDQLSQTEKKEIKSQMDNPEIAIKHKLKLTIPIVYKFLKYEGEIELGEKQKLPKNWDEVKQLFIREE